MDPAHKKHILQHRSTRSAAQLARDLGLKERAVKRFLEREHEDARAARNPAEPAAPPLPRPAGLLYFIPAAFALAGLVYSNVLESGFHYDDAYMIVENPAIRDLGQFGALLNAFNTRVVAGVTFAMNYAAHGLDPLGYHLVNILIHALASVAVYALVWLTLQTPRMKDRPLPVGAGLAAAFAALVFLAHPVQTQAVSYVWQRAAELAGLFYVSAVALYARWRLTGKKADAALSLGVMLLAMFTKEISITAPVAVALYEFVFFGTAKPASAMKKLLPFLCLLAVIPLTLTRADKISSNVMRPEAVTQKLVSGDDSAPAFDMTRLVTEESMPRRDYWMTQPNVIRTYFRLFFAPAGQNLDYDYPITSAVDLKTALTALGLAALAAAALLARGRFPLLSYGVLWIFLTMSVESLVVQLDVIYEHRMYLPMAGFAMASAAAAARLLKRPRIFAAFLTVLVLALSALSWQRNKVWKDEFTLWGDVVKKSPEKARGHYNLGLEYLRLSKEEEALKSFQKAAECDREFARKRSGRYYPDAVDDFLMIGNIYARRADFERALRHYEQALEIKLSLRGNPYKIYSNLANVYGQMGWTDKAIEHHDKAVRVAPRDFKVFFNAGNFYLGAGKTEEAVECLGKAVEIDPEHPDAKARLDLAKRRLTGT